VPQTASRLARNLRRLFPKLGIGPTSTDLRSTSSYGIKEATFQLTQAVNSYEGQQGNIDKQADSSTEYNNMVLQLIYIHRSTSPPAHEHEKTESVSIADKLRYNSEVQPSAHQGAVALLPQRPLPVRVLSAAVMMLLEDSSD
jgi:hypothetical protein